MKKVVDYEISFSKKLDELIRFSKAAADPQLDSVILAEGNTSVRTSAQRMLVKASGASLSDASEEDFVELDLSQLMSLIRSGPTSDGNIARVLSQATTYGMKKPSVEALLHAVCMEVPEVNAVAHTHPGPVNAILCSNKASYLMQGSLFPDQIVIMGKHQLMIPYLDPGLPLAQEALIGMGDHIRKYGEYPKVIYLLNHGMFALGASAEEAIQITTMAIKAARVLLGTLSIGEPTFLSEDSASRIDTRPDEVHRRKLLATYNNELR